jgi:hypothetical protein
MNIQSRSCSRAREATPALPQRRNAPFLPGLKAQGTLARFW